MLKVEEIKLTNLFKLIPKTRTKGETLTDIAFLSFIFEAFTKCADASFLY